jgi:hypothetical protein
MVFLVVFVLVELLLIFWAALAVLAIKGMIFNRRQQPDPKPAPFVEDESVRPEGLPMGCSLCIFFFFWPMLLAALVERWLGRNPPTRF